MNHHISGVAALLLAGAFGWFCIRDVDRGLAELPRMMWRVERRYDPALFWLFTAFNCFIIAALVLTGLKLLCE
ncbi:hypothetical protein [Sphingomonas bacterium]|uniref:hypothetical protein n=1 Tax=Sphingomonas bacterium TaxID=1895847 RepID=UPI001576C14E|nr:hypothetical protein [Sphingomonas bacterium]